LFCLIKQKIPVSFEYQFSNNTKQILTATLSNQREPWRAKCIHLPASNNLSAAAWYYSWLAHTLCRLDGQEGCPSGGVGCALKPCAACKGSAPSARLLGWQRALAADCIGIGRGMKKPRQSV